MEAIVSELADAHPASHKVAGIRVNRWAAVLEDYNRIKRLLQRSNVPKVTSIQLYELSQSTISQWYVFVIHLESSSHYKEVSLVYRYARRQKSEEIATLRQGDTTPAPPLTAPEALQPAIDQPTQLAVPEGAEVHHFEHQPVRVREEKAPQAFQMTVAELEAMQARSAAGRRRAAATVSAPQHPEEGGGAAPPPTAPLAPQDIPIRIPVAKTTQWNRAKREREDQQDGIPHKRYRARAGPNICQKCGSPATKEFGHSQFRGLRYCPATSGTTKEDWLANIRTKKR